jgi:alkylation response protein AidB-like acyl-CoA dehydrogenase
MNFELSEEQKMIQQAAKDFAERELLHDVIERDTNSRFPAEQMKKLAELGFLGMMTDPKPTMEVGWILFHTCWRWKRSRRLMGPSSAVVMSVCNSLVNWGLGNIRHRRAETEVPEAAGTWRKDRCFLYSLNRKQDQTLPGNAPPQSTWATTTWLTVPRTGSRMRHADSVYLVIAHTNA